MSNIRTYKISTNQNKSKNVVIYELYKEYKKYYRFQINKQYNEYLKAGRLNKFIETKNDKSKLSERYKRCVVGQVVGQLQAWISNRDNKIKEMIHECESLSTEQKRILHLVRIFNIKSQQEIEIKKELVKISKEDIVLFKSIKRSVKWNLPSNKKISMSLNNNVCSLVKKTSKKKFAKSFEYWIELSTLEKGKKFYIPATSNSYLNKQLEKGKLLNAIRIDLKGKYISFNLMIDRDRIEEPLSNKYEPKIDSIGIDFGTKNLFAVSTGHIFGLNFGKQLAKMDKRINILQKRLQKQNIKPNTSKRYRRLVFKCREFIENEINRNFNKIIKDIAPKEIVLEKLDFRNSKLSKSMNRILRKCGRSVVKSKLQMLQKDFGITIKEVNPAYTSQGCNNCGFVHKTNRKNRDKFQCKICNHKQNADINASRNIQSRSSCSVLSGKSSKRTIKNYLFEQFKSNNLQCAVIGSNINHTSPDRRAIFLIHNPLNFEQFFGIVKSRK
jgi:putative transposase